MFLNNYFPLTFRTRVKVTGKFFLSRLLQTIQLESLFSGGPIQVSHSDALCVYNIVGLTSYGSFKCGDKTPAVYTRVSRYLDWIEQKVWPNQ